MQSEIENASQLIEFFSSWPQASVPRKKTIQRGVYVTSQIRKEFLTSIHQGYIVVSGTHCQIKFENCQAGVWRAYIPELTIKGK